MLEFLIVMLVLDLLMKITVGTVELVEPPKRNPYDNGTADAYVLNNSWEFKSVDDCFEFRELRQSGWRGNAKDFYELKESEEQLCL